MREPYLLLYMTSKFICFRMDQHKVVDSLRAKMFNMLGQSQAIQPHNHNSFKQHMQHPERVSIIFS